MATKWLVERWEPFFFALDEMESVAEIEALCLAEIEAWRSRSGMKQESSLRVPMTDTRKEIMLRIANQEKQATVLKYMAFSEEWYRLHNAGSSAALEDRLEHQQLLRDPDVIVQKAIDLLASSRWEDLAIGLAMCTGRRPGEILKTAVFTKKTEYSVLFAGQLKRRDEETPAYEIPTLCSAAAAIDALARLRSLLDVRELDARVTTQKHSPLMQEAANKHFVDLVPVREGKSELYGHLFRSVYPRIAVFWYCPPTVADILFMATIQGHSEFGKEKDEEARRSYASNAHYFDYKIADAQGNIDGRQGIKLGTEGVELLEVFKPKPRKEKAVATKTNEIQAEEPAKGKNSPITVNKEMFNRVQALKVRLGHRTYTETLEVLFQAYEHQGDRSQAQELMPESFVSTEIASAIREAMDVSGEEHFNVFLTDALSKEAKFRTSLSKRHADKDFATLPTSELTRTKHPDAAKERIRRAVVALAAYNDRSVVAERWFINARTVQVLAGARYPIVEEWLKEHADEVTAMNAKHGLNQRYNSKAYGIKEVLSIPEEA